MHTAHKEKPDSLSYRVSSYTACDINQPMVANSHFMRVSAKVFDYLFGPKERPFAVHHPVLFKQVFVEFWLEIKM
jgi:hypothetical protein